MKKSIMSFFGGGSDSEEREVKSQQDSGEDGRPQRRWPLYAIAVFILAAIVAIAVVLSLPESSSGPATTTPTPTGTAEVTVSIEAPDTVSAGGEFVATVNVSGVEDFDSATYNIVYDPSVLEVVTVAQGAINATEVPVDMWGFIPQGIQGEVVIISNIPGVPGVNGSGHLSEIHFHVIGSGGDTSSLRFVPEEVSMADNKAADILANWIGSSVVVQ